MKANAPEKIYVHEASAPELAEKLPYHIEYTRTDAFIEKACEWMSNHLQMQYNGFSSFIKDFRKAMNENKL